jgi:hypothetical protein
MQTTDLSQGRVDALVLDAQIATTREPTQARCPSYLHLVACWPASACATHVPHSRALRGQQRSLTDTRPPLTRTIIPAGQTAGRGPNFQAGHAVSTARFRTEQPPSWRLPYRTGRRRVFEWRLPARGVDDVELAMEMVAQEP